nr:MAG TPA: hypothetical protein [Crassvirales sp.]
MFKLVRYSSPNFIAVASFNYRTDYIFIFAHLRVVKSLAFRIT